MRKSKLLTSFILFFMMLFLFGCEDFDKIEDVVITVDDEIIVDVYDDSFNLYDEITIIDEYGEEVLDKSEYVDLGDYDIDVKGRYEMTITYITSEEVEFTRSFTVFVSDNEAPVIILLGNPDVIINDFGEYIELGANVTDNYDEEVNLIIDSSAVNPAVPGDYTVTYNATDSNGNVAETVTRNVRVLDYEAPEYELSYVRIQTGDSPIHWEDYLVISDNFDNESDLSVVIEDNVNYDVAGRYQLFITITDTSGNETYSIEDVYVIERYHYPADVTNIVEYIDRFEFDVTNTDDTYFTNFSYTILVWVEELGEYIPLEGYIEVPITDTHIVVNGLEQGEIYQLKFEYTTVGNPDYILGGINSHIQLKEGIKYHNVRPMSTYATFEVFCDSYDSFISIKIENADSGVIEQILEVDIRDFFVIENLTPNTDYIIIYVFEGYEKEYEFTTYPQVEGTEQLFNFSIYQYDEDYTNSGVGIMENGEFVFYPVTSVVDGWGTVTVTYSFEEFDTLDEHVQVTFVRDINNPEETLFSGDHNTYISTEYMRDKVYLELNMFFLENSNHIEYKTDGQGLIILVFTDIDALDDARVYYDYDYTFEAYNNGTADEFVTNGVFYMGMSYSMLFHDELLSSLQGSIRVDSTATQNTLLEISSYWGEVCPEGIEIDNSDVRGSGVKVVYIVEGECQVSESYETYISSLEEHFTYKSLNSIINVNHVGLWEDNELLIITLENNEDINVLLDPSRISVFDNNGTKLEPFFYDFIRMKQEDDIPYGFIRKYDYQCENNLLDLLVNTNYDSSLLGIVGSFNNWDYDNPFMFTTNDVIEEKPSYQICTTENFGSYNIIYDSDENGFSSEDTLLLDINQDYVFEDSPYITHVYYQDEIHVLEANTIVMLFDKGTIVGDETYTVEYVIVEGETEEENIVDTRTFSGIE